MKDVLRSALYRLREANERRTVGVYFLGYPKTGNTWLRFMLGCYLQEAYRLREPPLFDEFDRLGRARKVGGLPGITFLHGPHGWEAHTAATLNRSVLVEPFRGKRVVLLARYPLDALVSRWHQMRTREDPPYRGDLVSFIEDPVLGLEKLLRFYTLWEDARAGGFPVALVRYEDLCENAERELEAVLAFLGVEPVQHHAVRTAVQRASFSSMKAMERSARVPRYASSGRSMFATGDQSDPNAFHVRRGEIGGYREELPAAVASRLERVIGAAMGGWYGYASLPVPARAELT